jgi:hypothetical protein
MRKRRVAATAAFVISIGSLGPLSPAHADAAGTTLYVDNTNAACTDTGTGTAAAPYCTVQAAAGVAVAGDTVDILAGTYKGGLTITQSGTSTEPIVFEGTWTQTTNAASTGIDGSTTTPALTFASGVRDVQFEGLQVFGGPAITLSGVSNVLFNGDFLKSPIDVSGASSAIAVERSMLLSTLTVSGGASGTVISTDESESGFVVDGATGTDITSNSVEDDVADIAVSGGSTDTTIENNQLSVDPLLPDAAENHVTLSVAADSTAGTVEQYNSFFTNPAYASFNPMYSWAGNTYSAVAAFQAASDQGAADFTGTYGGSDFGGPAPSSINSADSSAPGELSTDYFNNPRIDDPLFPETGTGSAGDFYDRGAVQIQDTFSGGFAAEPDDSEAITALSGEAGFVDSADSWSDSVTEVINWGDGTSSTVTNSVQAGGGIQDGLNLPTHAYSTPGTYKVTGTMTDGTVTLSGSESLTTNGSDFTADGPVRVLDTRFGIGASTAKIGAGASVPVQIAGTGSIPATGVTAVALTLTATETTGSGFVTAYSDGSEPGIVSNLNYTAGRTVANTVIVPVSSDGKIELYNGGDYAGPIDLVADVTGYFTQSAASGYCAIPAARLLDTRFGTGAGKAKVPADGTLNLNIAGADGGALPTGITAVSLNITATNTSGSGFITAFPDGESVPNASDLDYAPGQTVANSAIVPVGKDGKIELYNGGDYAGPVDLVADISGYYSASSPAAYVPIDPARITDTRTMPGYSVGKGDNYNTFPFTGISDENVPIGLSAYVLNITATQTNGSGYITAFEANSATAPNVSNLNYTPGETVANLAQVPSTVIPGDATVDLYNGGDSAGGVQLIEDLFGYYSTN